MLALKLACRRAPVRNIDIVRRFIHRSAEQHAVKPFLLADIGEGIAEVELLKWFVKEGDKVQQFDVLCEVQSDKANVEITSRYDGVVHELSHNEGDIAEVGAPLLMIDVEGDDDTEVASDVEKSTGNANAKSEAAASSGTSSPPAPPPPPTPSVSSIAAAGAAQTAGAAHSGKVLTTPAVRHIARNHNLDLSLVPATGPNGRILKGDVLAFLENGGVADNTSSQPTAATTGQTPIADRTEPIRGIKRMMVQSMTQSLNIPHFVYADEFEMSAASKVRKQINSNLKDGKKMSYMPLVLKAASLALAEFPILNSSISDDLTQITYHGSHNIGVAMDTPSGLLVPNIKNVQALSLQEISDELQRLQEAGSAGKLSQDDQTETTFSLSNIGAIGGTYAGPVIAPPQVSIGAMGKIQRLPRFDEDDNVVATEIMAVSWAADHRIIDGATMARFSNMMKSYLEDPLSMLLALR